MKRYTFEELRNEFAKHQYNWPHFHVVGVRSKANASDRFDDLIGVVDGNKLTWYSGTTNPGLHWLINLMNPKGTAVLVPGQYEDCYALGLHQGKYEALVQVRPVTVYRDKDRDHIAEETAVTETGLFGINIHRANPSLVSQLIGKWSAGCQVLNNPAEYAALIAAAKMSKRKFFTYTLLREF